MLHIFFSFHKVAVLDKVPSSYIYSFGFIVDKFEGCNKQDIIYKIHCLKNIINLPQWGPINIDEFSES